MTRGPDKQFDPDEALEAAMEVFWAKGYAATSLSELLDAMGIARKSLYDTFGSKRELFGRALDRYAHRMYGLIQGELQRPGSPLGNIRRVLERWWGPDAQRGNNGCMLGNNTAHFELDDEMNAQLGTYYVALEDAFVATLRRAREAGEIGPDAPVRDLARLLVAAAQGVALISRTRRDGRLGKSVARAALSAIEAS